MAFAWANAINKEAKLLDDLGVDIIQFDEPAFSRYPDKVEKWGVEAIDQCVGDVMLNKAIYDSYEANMAEISAEKSYTLLGQGTKVADALSVKPSLALTSGKKFLNHPKMGKEIFGPFSLIVSCENDNELSEILMKIAVSYTHLTLPTSDLV